MNIEDLRKTLSESEDKFAIFSDKDMLQKYSISTIAQLMSLISDFLTDEEKVKLFDLEHYKEYNNKVKSGIVKTILSDDIKLKMLQNSEITSGFENYQIEGIIDSLSSKGKYDFLMNDSLIEKFNLKDYKIRNLIDRLENNERKMLLDSPNLVKSKFKLPDYHICTLIKSFDDDEYKLQMLEEYNIEDYQCVDVLKTFSDSKKLELIDSERFNLGKSHIIELLSSLNLDNMLEVFEENSELLNKKRIKPYEITKKADKVKQLDLVKKLEEVNIETNEKNKILVTLSEDTKKELDISTLPNEYMDFINMSINASSEGMQVFGSINIDLDGDLEKYRGLDDMISLKGMHLDVNQKENLMRLCEICPQIKILDDIDLAPSTGAEYIEAENWLKAVKEGINPEWDDIRKIAYVDHMIGKRISYTPDFNTEVCNEAESRALWKIIATGYGVCNGIAQVGNYILEDLDIESEIISTGKHSFLKLINIEIPNADGTKSKGDTILDSTWNLTAQRFGAVPQNFCLSYEEIRKADIDENGNDTACHKNDEKLESATLSLDKDVMRKIYASIGLADKDLQFPIKDLIDKSNEIDKLNLPTEEAIKKQFELLQEYCPEFSKCQNSTISILQGVLLEHENLEFNSCCVDRVYSKGDEKREASFYVYADIPDVGKRFYVVDKENSCFVNLSQKDFEERFECYDTDLEKQNGHRPWEDIERVQIVEDLALSSGKVSKVASEGEAR